MWGWWGMLKFCTWRSSCSCRITIIVKFYYDRELNLEGCSLHDLVVWLFLRALWFLEDRCFQSHVFYQTVYSAKWQKATCYNNTQNQENKSPEKRGDLFLVHTGRLHPKIQTLTILYTISYPFIYYFHIPRTKIALLFVPPKTVKNKQ